MLHIHLSHDIKIVCVCPLRRWNYRKMPGECHGIVTLDRQWDSLEEIRSLTRISRYVGQSVAQLGEECDAGCVDGTEGLQSHRLKNVGAWERRVFGRLFGHSMLRCTTWTGGDWDIGLGHRIHYGNIPCQLLLARDSMLSALYAIARPSVRLSVTRVDQSKTV